MKFHILKKSCCLSEVTDKQNFDKTFTESIFFQIRSKFVKKNSTKINGSNFLFTEISSLKTINLKRFQFTKKNFRGRACKLMSFCTNLNIGIWVFKLMRVKRYYNIFIWHKKAHVSKFRNSICLLREN